MQAAPGDVSAVGWHDSAQQRSSLDGRYYGTGARGREAERVRAAPDPRIKERIYLYVDSGKGITPEQGVGSLGVLLRRGRYRYARRTGDCLPADIERLRAAGLDIVVQGRRARIEASE